MYITVNFIFIKFLKNFGLTMIALCSVIPEFIAVVISGLTSVALPEQAKDGFIIRPFEDYKKALSGEGACEHNFDLEGRVEDFGSAALALCGGVCA